ncbi:thiolase C-terminal domain-containing protein [Actinophytocola oryzae]|uniref:Acetyl-CoA acetyltransferase n=1 Tax=Actinophytocola oryzae TaxID=502181 RepID=A0A4R7W1R7_9PSEU|nr:thiolase [Actinophytocola oryzae]TDV56523.1 acetyl-CoA acetyltransferase [Actinophytocola oryzae]
MTGAAIIGAAETARVGRIPDQSVLGLNVEAGVRALADALVSVSEVDGIAGAFDPRQVAHELGIRPRWVDGTNVGGCSFLLHVRHAAAAIRAGYANTVLITHGESGRSRVGTPPRPPDPASLTGQFEEPYGARAPFTRFTLPALRYMKTYGLSHEELASVPVAQRQWASRNPRALLRDPLTVEDVLAAPLVAYPFHKPEVCVVTDGGGALVVTSARRAGDRAVRVLGAGESVDSPLVAELAEPLGSAAARRAADDAFAEAGVDRSDVDHVMCYDAFAHLPIIGLEALGLLKPGEAGGFVAAGHTAPGGRLPVNTNGGGLSYTHTGMYGMFAIQESVRQLRGEAAAQVSDVELSAVLGFGGMYTAAAVLVLGRQ